MPQISVVVPVYKVEKYLNRCVDSILAQTFWDFELILVDDGSPDNCGVICDEYAGKDSRIHVIHQKNGGLSAARNAGIDWAFANSDSEWLSFIDSDDWVLPVFLEALFDAVKSSGEKIALCGLKRTKGDTAAIEKKTVGFHVESPETYYCSEYTSFTVAWNKIYKKALFKKIRYPVGKIHEDEFTTYKMMFACHSIAVVDGQLYMYFQNPEGIMGQKWNPNRLSILEALDERIQWLKRKRNLNAALDYTVELRFLHTRDALDYIERDISIYGKELQRKVQKNMGYFLLRHPIKYPFEKNKWYYELAFPHQMNIYWIIRAQCEKLFHKNL